MNLVGKRSGRLLVIATAAKDSHGHYQWLCKCDCGNEHIIATSQLTHQKTRSCGCLRRDTMRAIIQKYKPRRGMPRLYGWSNWQAMVSRCYNPNDIGYRNYGGRGIRVCEFLRATHRNLLDLIGVRPSAKHTVDRIDNDGHYSCGACSECFRLGLILNVRWATRKEQGRNRRNNVRLTLDGRTHCVSAWAEELKIPETTIRTRMKNGVSIFGETQ